MLPILLFWKQICEIQLIVVYQAPELNLQGLYIRYQDLDISEVIKFKFILDATVEYAICISLGLYAKF
jgi:hypothetical protein